MKIIFCFDGSYILNSIKALFSEIQHVGHILSRHYGLRSKYYKSNNKIYSAFHRLQPCADAYIYNNFKNKPPISNTFEIIVLNEMKNINPDNIFYCFKSCLCGYRRKGKLKHSLSNSEKKEILNIYAKLKIAPARIDNKYKRVSSWYSLMIS